MRWTVPEGWVEVPPEGTMRVAQYRTAEGAAVAVFAFGHGGGDVASNLERWKEQFERLDSTWIQRVAGSEFPITLVLLQGNFHGTMGPQGPVERGVQMGVSLVGAIVEAPAGMLFFKSVVPRQQEASVLAGLRRLLVGMRRG